MAGDEDREKRARRRGAGLAVLVTLVQTLGSTLLAGNLDWLAYVLLVVGGFSLADRLRHPRRTLLIATSATVAYLVLGYGGFIFPTPLLAAVGAIKAGRRGAVWLAAIAGYTAWAVLTGVHLGQGLGHAAWGFAIGLICEVILGVGTMLGRLAQEQSRAYKEKQLRQASEERLRIAQELHDVLGHHLSLINMRAAVGLHLMDRQPEQARAALDTVKQASAEALREVRSVLDALRPVGEAAPRQPAPGLERLSELTGGAGLRVVTRIEGEPRELPAEIERAAYRIVQESLTNVRRHAGMGAAAAVTLDYRQTERVSVRIEDDGGAAGEVAPAPPGNGISGMRERASALGGDLVALPLPRGGWRVEASLPTPSTVEDAVEDAAEGAA